MAARLSLFAPDLLGRHVLTKSDELRVTVIVGGPFKEIDHFDQDRSQPLAVLHIRRREAGAPDRSWLQADLRTHDSLIMTGRRAVRCLVASLEFPGRPHQAAQTVALEQARGEAASDVARRAGDGDALHSRSFQLHTDALIPAQRGADLKTTSIVTRHTVFW